MPLYYRKSQNIKIYEEFESTEGKVKKYIHNPSKSLHAYARQLSSNEETIDQSYSDTSVVKFVVNYRKISKGMMIEFNNITYKIISIDRYEFIKSDLTLIGVEVETPNYVKIEWTDSQK